MKKTETCNPLTSSTKCECKIVSYYDECLKGKTSLWCRNDFTKSIVKLLITPAYYEHHVRMTIRLGYLDVLTDEEIEQLVVGIMNSSTGDFTNSCFGIKTLTAHDIFNIKAESSFIEEDEVITYYIMCEEIDDTAYMLLRAYFKELSYLPSEEYPYELIHEIEANFSEFSGVRMNRFAYEYFG